uniref:Uncharacterized protein n=1 Tax=Ditylenchus dipsaci TaxID=166011 RepID=A0A915DXI9_9BILA
MDLKNEDDNGKVFIDDLNKVRLANPDLFESSNTLKEESDHFIGQLEDFSSLVHSVRSTLEEVSYPKSLCYDKIDF